MFVHFIPRFLALILLRKGIENGGAMREVAAPIRRTAEDLDQELASLKEQMAPLSVEHLRRLRDAGAIEYEEERLLDRYDACMWLRYGVA